MVVPPGQGRGVRCDHDRDRVITLSRGFQSDPIKEHAALIEIEQARVASADAHRHLGMVIRQAIDGGVRAQVIADHLRISRATLYRTLAD